MLRKKVLTSSRTTRFHTELSRGGPRGVSGYSVVAIGSHALFPKPASRSGRQGTSQDPIRSPSLCPERPHRFL